MSSSSVFVARQPIMDRKNNLFGYELLFRTGFQPNSTQENDLNATLSVTRNLLQGYGYKKILQNKIGFININDEILQKNIISSLTPERFIFEILESTSINSNTIELIKKYKEMEYRFAIDDFILNNENMNKYKDIWHMIDIVKIDVLQNTVSGIKNRLQFFYDNNIQLLAEKVESREIFNQYVQMNFSLFQGYYFSKPVIMPGKKLDPQKKSILNLIAMVKKDTDINALESEFTQNPELSINLLKFINSSAMGISQKVKSIRSAISLIGRKQLLQWLILLSYAADDQSFNENSPLLSLVSQRSSSMRRIALKISPENKDFSDSAYLVGLVSFLDVLFQIPLEDILEEIALSQELINAVLKMEGPLGQILEVARLSERGELNPVEKRLKEWNISRNEFNDSILKSFQWNF